MSGRRRGKGAHLMTQELLERTRAAASSSCWGRVQIDGPGSDAPSRLYGAPERPRCKARSRLHDFGLCYRRAAFAQGQSMRDQRDGRWKYWVRNGASLTSKASPPPAPGPCFRRSKTHDG